MRERAVLLIAAAVACGGPRPSRMYPAGSDKDDGYGDLARMSARLSIGGGSDASPFAAHRRRARPEADPYGGDAYGDASDGDAPDGAADSAGAGATADTGAPIAPQGGLRAALPRYTPTTGLTGAIEGTVTWRGAPPPPLTTACGAIDNPGVHVAANRAVAGVLVYIEHVEIGRTLPSFGRPAVVGGIIAKRGCVLGPTIQILTPLPADLAIHGDATEVKLRVTQPAGTRPFELQPAGRIVLAAQPGVTRVEADDDSLAPAWVVAASTPYYAITDERGRFRIDELATGTYDVTFWQPPLATTVNGKLVYGAPVVVHRSIKVDQAHLARLDLALP
ncbi:MAG TPA: hypothetical protein VHW23_31250 [Kofleriaceae bacterium]|jgi:hypothetical protein|nr:hypothetical protein [Kofleriaceae bacterium]